MSTVVPAPDTSDERLASLIQWTRKAGMPDVHVLLQELQQHRAKLGAEERGLLERWRAEVRPVPEPSLGFEHEHNARSALLDRLLGALPSSIACSEPSHET